MTRTSDYFPGKIALVMGASAEGGSGWAIAEALAAEGAKVIVAARTTDALQRLAERIDGTAISCDVGDEAQVADLAKRALELHGRVDIAINSAGSPAAMGLVKHADQDLLNAGLRVNFFGNVYFVKYMAEAIGSDGSIVLISSMSTTHPLSPFFAYACGKAATDCLVRYAALEYGANNIRINSILPGLIRSDVSREALQIPGFEDAYNREIPLGRISEPEDIADAVLWLSGPAHVTGLNVPISGGNQLTRFPYLRELPFGEESFGSGKPLADR